MRVNKKKNDKIHVAIIADGQWNDMIEGLKKHDFKVKRLESAQNIIGQITQFNTDIIFIGKSYCAKLDGVELCNDVRHNPMTKGIPILFISESPEEYLQLAAYDAGCDEYIIFPLKNKLLKAKIHAVVNRYIPHFDFAENTILKFGNIEIDEEEVMVYKKGEALELSKKEFLLLMLLTTKPGKVFRRNTILTKVWGDDIIVGDRNIDTHIKKLRKKIGKEHIQTVRGIGYKFQV